MTPPDWQTYSPDPSPDPERPERSPVRPAIGVPARQARKSGRPAAVVGVIAALTALGAVGGVVAATGGSDEQTAAARSASGPQTAEGFGSMVTALEAETGTTEVFEAVIYPEYAVVDAPFERGDEREVSYYWDGEDLDESTKGTSDYALFDLAEVDASLFPRLCEEVEALVEDPETCYLIVRRPRPGLEEGWLWAYTSNEFSQGGYISYSLEGAEVSRTEW